MSDAVAIRYAKAAFDSIGAKQSGAVVRELGEIASVIEDHEELRLALCSALFSRDKKRALAESLCETFKLSKETQRLFLVLSEAGRMDCARAVAKRLEFLILESQDVVPLSVESSEKLDDDQKKKIQEQFKRILGKEVSPTFKVAPGAIGSLRAEAAGRTYDGTLSTRLSSLKEQLVGGI